MRRRTSLILLVLAVPVLAGCQKVQARMELKKGNNFYKNETYQAALEQYKKGLELDPSATFAWRSVGFSALALYRPGVDTAENKGYADTAIDAFNKYLADYPDDQKVSEYLTSMLVTSGRHDEALARLREEVERDPENVASHRAILSVLLDGGRLDEAQAYLGKPGVPQDPTLYYTLGVSAWKKSYDDYTLDAVSRGRIVDMGMGMLQKAIELKPDYAEAMSYLNLLYREKASKVETDPFKQQDLIAEADKWRNQAMALLKKQQPPKPAA